MYRRVFALLALAVPLAHAQDDALQPYVVVAPPKACFLGWDPPSTLGHLDTDVYTARWKNCGGTRWTTSGSQGNRVWLSQTVGQHPWGNYFPTQVLSYSDSVVEPGETLTVTVRVQADAYDGPVNQYVSGTRQYEVALDHAKFRSYTGLHSIFIDCYQSYCDL